MQNEIFFFLDLYKPVSISPKNQWLNGRKSPSYGLLPFSEEPIIKVSKKKKWQKTKSYPAQKGAIPSSEQKALLWFPKCLLDIPRPLSWWPLLTPWLCHITKKQESPERANCLCLDVEK